MATKANTNETVADQVNETDTPNTPDLVSIGQDAIKALSQGNKAIGKANALFTYVIAQAYMTKIFKCTIAYKDAPEEHSFDLEDIATSHGIMKTDGKKDNIKSKARLDCVAHELFGIDKEFDVSQRNMFMDCLNAIYHLGALDWPIDECITLSAKNNLVVPYDIMVDAPDEKKEAAFKEHEAKLGSDFILDGSDRKHTFAELKRRVTPDKKRAPGSGQGGENKPVELKGSIDFLVGAIKALNDDTGEIVHNYAALNNEATDKLFQLHIQLGKYFKSNPVQTKETGNKSKAA
jgi:hypothetical protein